MQFKSVNELGPQKYCCMPIQFYEEGWFLTDDFGHLVQEKPRTTTAIEFLCEGLSVYWLDMKDGLLKGAA